MTYEQKSDRLREAMGLIRREAAKQEPDPDKIYKIADDALRTTQ